MRFNVLIVLVVAAACAAPQTFDEAAASLRTCPVGDGPWREAVRRAEREDRSAELAKLAEDLAEKCPDRWEPLWTAGRSLDPHNAGEYATDLFGEARKRAAAAGDPVGVARSANQLGWLAYAVGDLAEAEEFYREALDAAGRAERLDLESFIRNNLAGTLLDMGDFVGSRHQLEQAQQGLETLERDDAAVGLAFNRAVIQLELGDARESLTILERVHGRAREAGDAWTSDAAAVVAGNVHLSLGQTDASRGWHERVSSEFPDLKMLAEVGLGRAAMQEGEFSRALNILGPIEERAGAGEKLFADMTRVLLAEAELRSGDRQRSRARLQELVAGEQEPRVAEAAWAAWWLLGRISLDEGDHAAAIAASDRAVQLLDKQGDPLDPLSDGLYFLRHRSDPYAVLAVALALSGGGETSRQRILDVLQSAQARALRQAIDRDTPVSADLQSIRAALGPREAMLIYLLGEERGVVMAIRRDDAAVIPIEGRRTLIEPLSRYLEDLRDPEVGSSEASARRGRVLREHLLDPVDRRLAGVERVYIVPDRELSLLPFSAIPLGQDDFMGDVYEVGMLPAAGVPPRWKSQSAPVLLAGRPDLDGQEEFVDLPWAAFELSRLQRLWEGDGTMLLGNDFDVSAFRQFPLGEFRTIHMATHATASTVDPRRCGVVMSGGRRLGIEDIVDLPLDSSLVVLSACSTGLGELVPGQGVISLGWAFLVAGAQGVVVSQWTVDDNSSARLMIAFHERLREGVDPVRALTLAQRQIAAGGAGPSHWSPFVIVLRPE